MRSAFLTRIFERIGTKRVIFTLLTGSLACAFSIIIYWKTLFARFDLHSLCSYISMGLPILGFVALRGSTIEESPSILTVDSSQPEEQVFEDLRKKLEIEWLEEQWHKEPTPAAPPLPTPKLTAGEFLLYVIAKPHLAFLEIKNRLCLEVCIFPLVFHLFLALSFRDVTVSFLTNYLIILAGFPFYELGKVGIMMIVSRFLKRPLSLASSLFAVMVMDLSPAILMMLLLPFPGLIGWAGHEFFFRPGLGDLVSGLAITYPLLFNLLAQLNLFALWSFFLWSTGLATLLDLSLRRCLAVALLSYTIVHFLLCPALLIGRVLVVW